MPGAATTYYDVVTRYKLQDQMSQSMGRMDRNVGKIDKSLAGLKHQTAMVGRGFRRMAMMAGPLVGGMIGMVGVAMALTKTFRNLNEEQNSTIQLAAQVNLAFQFEGATGAADNFTRSMGASRKVFRELVKDAAALPGELQDFIAIAQQISGGVFKGGGNLQTMRSLTAKIALAAPAAGAGFEQAGLGAMQMLFGVARVTNPLFKMLAGQGLLPKAEAFNVLPAEERLRRLNDALSELTDNPMFRRNILGTWDTQLGTLADNLFGIEGIMGQLARGPFNDMLDWLTELNVEIGNNTPAIVEGFRRVADAFAMLGSAAEAFKPPAPKTPLLGGYERKVLDAMFGETWGLEATAGMTAMSKFIGSLQNPLGGGPINPWKEYQGNAAELHRKRGLREMMAAEANQNVMLGLLGMGPEAGGFRRRNVSKTKISQTFHVKLDLKSDEAPEAIAVKLTKALEKTGRNPTTVSRGLGAVAATSGAGP